MGQKFEAPAEILPLGKHCHQAEVITLPDVEGPFAHLYQASLETEPFRKLGRAIGAGIDRDQISSRA